MADETEEQVASEAAEGEAQDAAQDPAGEGDEAQGGAQDDAGGSNVESPEYQEFADSGASGGASDMARVQSIQVSVSAELGRAAVPIQRLMELTEGSVLSLDREIDSPIELVAQGVSLAAGEVVVVDGCFAIRITEVFQNN